MSRMTPEGTAASARKKDGFLLKTRPGEPKNAGSMYRQFLKFRRSNAACLFGVDWEKNSGGMKEAIEATRGQLLIRKIVTLFERFSICCVRC